MRRRIWIKKTAWFVVAIMFLIGFVPRVDAAFLPSAVSPSQQARDLDVTRVQKFLETKMVQDRLEKLGFTSDEVQAKLAGLSDEQLHELALKIDDIKVAGDGLGIIIALLIIAILIVVLLQVTGHKVVVK